ncbi:hypothetical protein [Bacillus sp. FJAT-45350]|nr:hypothetical protein [Bacillus sp. FJAT-45350]
MTNSKKQQGSLNRKQQEKEVHNQKKQITTAEKDGFRYDYDDSSDI